MGELTMVALKVILVVAIAAFLLIAGILGRFIYLDFKKNPAKKEPIRNHRLAWITMGMVLIGGVIIFVLLLPIRMVFLW